MAAPLLHLRPPKSVARWTRTTDPEKLVSLGVDVVCGEDSVYTGAEDWLAKFTPGNYNLSSRMKWTNLKELIRVNK